MLYQFYIEGSGVAEFILPTQAKWILLLRVVRQTFFGEALEAIRQIWKGRSILNYHNYAKPTHFGQPVFIDEKNYEN